MNWGPEKVEGVGPDWRDEHPRPGVVAPYNIGYLVN